MILSPSSAALLRSSVCATSLALAFVLSPAAFAQDGEPVAQDAPEDTGEGGEIVNEIVVSGARLRGQLDTDVPPLLELNEEDIAAEGVTSIADLITQISNQTGSARGRGGGRPVILINGIRVGSFREFSQYPPEALERVEVFPEEVAQKFGYSPDQRVINLILKDDFSSREVEVELEAPTRGGFWRNEQELGYLKIADGGRLNLNLEASDSSLLTESERDIIQTPGSVSDIATDPDQAFYRSLSNDTRNLEGTISWAKAFLDSGTSVSASLGYERADRLGLSGLNTVVLTDPDGDSVLRTFGAESPLTVDTAVDTVSGSGSISKAVNSFQLTTTFDGSLSETEQRIDQRFDTSGLRAQAAAGTLALDAVLPTRVEPGIDIANTRVISGSSQATLRGPLAYLPAGELSATFDAGLDWTQIDSADTRTLNAVELTRRRASTGANLIVPITSRREGFADALGSFTLTAQAGLEDLSDFGLLGDYNVALNWAPTDTLNFSANYIYREVAPSLAALGNPQITLFNTPVFDFSTGETVLATVTTGGNPNLLPETQRDWRFAANWELPFWENTRFTVEYIRNRSSDVTSGFPQITPEIEAAFPGRITRDDTGRLISVDRRSVTFAETQADRLQFNLQTRGSFGEDSEEQSEGRRGGRRGPPAASQQTADAGPSDARREQFMKLRERLCADDGLAFLTRLIERVDAGEEVGDEIPGFDAERFKQMLARVRDANGNIDPERLAAFRERLCSVDPSTFGNRGGEGPGGEGGPMREAFTALRERVCGDDGADQLARIVAAIENGEDLSATFPGLDPEMLKRMLDRARGEDGKISPEALEQFRTRVCSRGEGQGGQQGQRGGGPFGGGNPLQRGGFSGWRYFVSLNSTVELQNQILIAPGLAPLDQLDGDATGAYGLPRFNSRLEAGLFGGGIGFRLSGQYTGSSRLDGTGLAGSPDLFIGDLVTFDLRAFSNLGELLKREDGFLDGLRVSLRLDNIFDTRREVRDSNGVTPINYQPFLIDPVGRYVGIDVRKLF